MGSGATAVNLLGIASAFGFAIVAMAYGIGPISGCHVNPAVSFGVYVAGRMSAAEMVSYWIAQVLGAIVGAAALYLILSGKAQGWTGGLGQNGWGPGYLGEYNVVAAFVFEVVGTFLFLVCILGVTHPFSPTGFAGLAIGLTLVAIHLVGINITGTSVNPARSIGPALIGIGSDPQGRRAALAVHHRAAYRRRRGRAAVHGESLSGLFAATPSLTRRAGARPGRRSVAAGACQRGQAKRKARPCCLSAPSPIASASVF